MDDLIKKYLSKIGRKGGQSRSEAKVEAVKANALKAAAARRLYKPCPCYNNHSHRFNPKTDKCYGCGYRKPKQRKAQQ
jgi:hypothetical protein